MAKAIANLAVSVTARTDKFAKGLKRARKSVRRFGRSITKLARGAVGMGAALTAIAAGGGMAYMIKKSMEGIDATTKWGQRLGIATKDLVGLQHAAALSGVKMEALNMGLQRMTRRMAEAAMDTGEAKDAIKTLGIDAKKAATKSPYEMFLDIAEAMQKVTTQGERVRLAFKLFDSEGVALVNVLARGRAGIEEMNKEAAKLGLSFDEHLGNVVATANDNMNRLREVFRGVFQAISIESSPIFSQLVKDIVEWATTGEGMAIKVSRAFETMLRIVAKLADYFAAIRAIWNAITGVFTAGISLFAGKPGGHLQQALGEQMDTDWRQMKESWGAFREGEYSSRVEDYIRKSRAAAHENQSEGSPTYDPTKDRLLPVLAQIEQNTRDSGPRFGA